MYGLKLRFYHPEKVPLLKANICYNITPKELKISQITKVYKVIEVFECFESIRIYAKSYANEKKCKQ